MADVSTLVIEVDGRPVSQAEAALLSLKNASDEAADSVDLLASVYGKLTGIISTTVIVDAIKNVALLGSQYEMLGATMGVMANNAGLTKIEMQSIQEKMEETGISALRARQGLQIMAAAQIDLNKAAELGRVAQDGATLARINSSEAFARLVQGISTGEARIIRHMGIMVNFKSAINEYARANHVAVESIDAKTLAEIRLDAVLAEGYKRQGVYEAAMTTAGKQMLSMARYTENFKVRLGETFNPATEEVVFRLVEAFKSASEALKDWQDSGGQAEFASGLRHDVESLINGLITLGQVAYDARTPIEFFMTVFTTVKITNWLVTTVAAMRTAVNESVMGNVRMAEATVARARASVAATAAEIEDYEVAKRAANGQILETIIHKQGADAKVRHLIAVKALARAKQELAVATEEATGAEAAWGAVVNALGGYIGVAMIAITGLIFLYQKLKDSRHEDAEDSERSIDDMIIALDKRQRVLKDIIKKREAGDKKGAKKAVEEAEIDKTPEIAREIAVRDKLQAQLEKFNQDNKDLLDTQQQLNTAGEAYVTVLEAIRAKATQKDIQKDLDAAEAALERARAKVAATRKLEHKVEDSNLDLAAQKAEEIHAANAQRMLYYKTQMAAMEEKITDASYKGIGLTKQAIEFKKLEAETAKKIADWTAMANEIDKKTGTRRLDDTQLKNLIARRKEEEAKLKAAYIRSEGEASDERVYSDMQKMREDSDAYNRSLEETIELEMWRSVNLADGNITESEFLDLIKEKTDLTILAKRRANDESEIYLKTIKDINEQERLGIISAEKAMKARFDAENNRSGGRLAATATPEETYAREVAQLEAYRKNGGDLVTYQRSLIKLKEASGSAWAAMGQAVKGYTDQTSTLLADFFNGTSTNWHKMFASMLRDMEAAIIKAMIMKPVMDALAASLTSLTKGGGPGFWATFASYFNGSTPSTPSTGNYSNIGSGLNTSGAGGFTGKLPSVGPYSGASAAFSVAGMPTSQAKAAQPRGTGDVYLSVTVATNGSAQTQERGNNDQGIAVARSLAAKMREVIIDEQRPNGIIYDFVHGR
jgi:hypothetical protein